MRELAARQKQETPMINFAKRVLDRFIQSASETAIPHLWRF
ncbi:hypothetical protein [Altericroceibacterium xinjiangense]|nr:hypothetical protein [Altericroceibacterium xinjiangense]